MEKICWIRTVHLSLASPGSPYVVSSVTASDNYFVKYLNHNIHCHHCLPTCKIGNKTKWMSINRTSNRWDEMIYQLAGSDCIMCGGSGVELVFKCILSFVNIVYIIVSDINDQCCWSNVVACRAICNTMPTVVILSPFYKSKFFSFLHNDTHI